MRRVPLVALMCLVSLACGSSSPTTPTVSYEGRWTGSTGQSLPVSFTVNGSQITDFSFDYSFDYSGIGVVCRTTIAFAPGNFTPVTGNSFRFTLSRPDGTVRTTVSGTFTSASQATGQFSDFTLTNLPCGSQVLSGTYTSPPHDFSATKS